MSARVEDVLIPGSPRDILILTACKRWAQITGTADADASAIIAALRAAGLVIEQGWQPISTAPRDKMLMTGHTEDSAPIMGYYHRGAWREHNGKGTVIHPTHWRPLPAPPQETTDA